jgi:hypothetical protein
MDGTEERKGRRGACPDVDERGSSVVLVITWP